MKFENILLRTLFVLSSVLCAAILGSMLFMPHPRSMTAATQAQAHTPTLYAVSTVVQPLDCPLLPDGVLCVRQD